MLAGDKPGDNAQCLSLAAALGWPTEVKDLRYRRLERRGRFPFRSAVRFELDVAASSPLAPPWPELVIGCGRRSVPVALGIRERAGGGTRLVQLGRPRANLADFDLVVTTPQYRLPERANVLQLGAPMHRRDEAALARAAAEWEPRLAHLPRPRIALLVGGQAKPFVFPAERARALALEASRLAAAEGGALLVTTSRRTPEDAVEALTAALTGPHHVHRWSGGGDANPYLAFLALADAFVVTGDSASMLAEACATGRPVYLFDLPQHLPASWRRERFLRNLLLAPSGWAAGRGGIVERIARLSAEIPARGWIRYPRDLSRLHASLIAEGRVRRLGDRFERPPPPPIDETERAAQRVRALMAEAR